MSNHARRVTGVEVNAKTKAKFKHGIRNKEQGILNTEWSELADGPFRE
jgi:hypothetical protein